LEGLDWQPALFEQLTVAGLRVPRPRRTKAGGLVADGWIASTWLAGTHEPRWGEIVAAGDSLHAALQEVRRPAFLARRTDRWSIADRVAWGELPLDDYLHVKHV